MHTHLIASEWCKSKRNFDWIYIIKSVEEKVICPTKKSHKKLEKNNDEA